MAVGWLAVLLIKSYWNTEMPICLLVSVAAFELQGRVVYCNRDCIYCPACNIYCLAFCRKFADSWPTHIPSQYLVKR